MERIGDEVSRELRRHGPQAGMGELLAAWSAAVGPQIARNAWPARIARDGTVHVHTADAVWAFELGHRAPEIAARLGVTKLRFAPGPLPTPASDADEGPRSPAVEPAPEDEEAAAAVTASVEDEELRARIARAVALGLASARSVGRI